jgi:hypothetical protein
MEPIDAPPGAAIKDVKEWRPVDENRQPYFKLHGCFPDTIKPKSPIERRAPMPRAPMPTYKVIFTKPNGATRVVRVVAESPGAAQQKAGLPQNEESVEVTEEKYERAAFVRESSRRGSNTRIAPDTVDPRGPKGK